MGLTYDNETHTHTRTFEHYTLTVNHIVCISLQFCLLKYNINIKSVCKQWQCYKYGYNLRINWHSHTPHHCLIWKIKNRWRCQWVWSSFSSPLHTTYNHGGVSRKCVHKELMSRATRVKAVLHGGVVGGCYNLVGTVATRHEWRFRLKRKILKSKCYNSYHSHSNDHCTIIVVNG